MIGSFKALALFSGLFAVMLKTGPYLDGALQFSK
jgi:hypothetical protein